MRAVFAIMHSVNGNDLPTYDAWYNAAQALTSQVPQARSAMYFASVMVAPVETACSGSFVHSREGTHHYLVLDATTLLLRLSIALLEVYL